MSVKASPNRRKEEGKENKKKKQNKPPQSSSLQLRVSMAPTASTLPLPDYIHIVRHFEF